MKTVIQAILGYAIGLFLSWLLGGVILTLAIRHCLFVGTIAATLGVADLTFVNYANASLVIAALSMLRFNAKVGK